MDNEITTSHKIYYSNKDQVPLSDVAESLLALEGIINECPAIIEKLFPGVKINAVNVFINELQAGSLWEDIVVKFIFGSQERFDEFISNTREKMGMDYLQSNPNLLSTIIISLILAGGLFALDKSFNTKPEDKTAIENNNNIIINFGAEMADMSPEQFKDIIENNIKDKGKLTKNVVKVIHPAKKDKGATITFDKNINLSLTSDAIQAVPIYLMDDEPEEIIEDYKNIELSIRATDLDSKKRGWAAVIPSLSNRRTKLQIDLSIDSEALLEMRTFKGDVTVVFRYDDKGLRYPSLIFLRDIAGNEER